MGFEEVAELPVDETKYFRATLVDFLNSGIKYAKTDLNPARVSQIRLICKRHEYPIRISTIKGVLYFERLEEGAK